jgi:hypothetical protein
MEHAHVLKDTSRHHPDAKILMNVKAGMSALPPCAVKINQEVTFVSVLPEQ